MSPILSFLIIILAFLSTHWPEQLVYPGHVQLQGGVAKMAATSADFS